MEVPTGTTNTGMTQGCTLEHILKEENTHVWFFCSFGKQLQATLLLQYWINSLMSLKVVYFFYHSLYVPGKLQVIACTTRGTNTTTGHFG